MMYQQNLQANYASKNRFNNQFFFPAVAILGMIQMLSTLAILGLECGRVSIDTYKTNLFAGFWTSLPFTVLWISMFSFVCCCQQRNCAGYVAIHNFISLFFAGALVGIDIAFIYHPDKCFLAKTICDKLSKLTKTGSYDKIARLELIKIQLAVAGVMLVTCVLYLIGYCIFVSQASSKTTSNIGGTHPQTIQQRDTEQSLSPVVRSSVLLQAKSTLHSDIKDDSSQPNSYQEIYESSD